MFSYKLSTISILLLVTCLSTYFNVGFPFCSGLMTDMDMDTLMCYNCTTENKNKACADPMGKSVSMPNCLKGENCLKFVFTTADNTTQTIRSCSARNASCNTYTAAFTKKYGNFTELNCKICNINHCNSATTFGLSLAALFLPMISNFL